eukprot:228066-Alexandrium_andersonii.AAC.1
MLATSRARSGGARPAAEANCSPSTVARSLRKRGTKGYGPRGPRCCASASRAGGPGRTNPPTSSSSGSTRTG